MQIWRDTIQPPSSDYLWCRLNENSQIVGWFENRNSKWIRLSKKEVSQILCGGCSGGNGSGSNGLSLLPVEQLGDPSEDTLGLIFLVPSSDPQNQNIKDEFVTVRSGEEGNYTYSWEQIGSTAIDLDGYVTDEELADALALKQDANLDSSYGELFPIEGEGGQSIPSTTGFVTTTYLQQQLATKQDVLTSGTNIKTINNESLLGSGNIVITGGSGSGDENVIESITVNNNPTTVNNKNVDITVPTSLSDLSDDVSHRLVTDAEKSAWNNKSTFSGNYNDLSNKPTIPAAQVQANWNETNTSSKSYILNKPTIPAAQVQSDWNASSGMGVILNKPVIPTVPTNLSSFTDDLGNNPVHTHSQYLTAHQNISGKQDKFTITTSGTATQELANNTEYRYTSATASLTVSEPSVIPNDYMSWLVFVSGATATSFNYPVSWYWSGDNVNNGTFVPAANTTYNVCIWYDGLNINAIARGV